MFTEKYVLCIDDDPDDCDLLEEALKNINSDVRLHFEGTSDNALRFLEEAQRQNNLPGLIVLDLNMPGLNGKETFTLFKTNPVLANIPIIIFTTSTQDYEILEMEKRGVTVFQKPNKMKDYDGIAMTVKNMIL